MLKSKIKQIQKLPFVKNTLKLSSSSVVLMFLPLLVTPILSRLYTPADYGDWGVFSSVYYIIIAFLFLSYENTIVKSTYKEEVPNLVFLCVLVSLAVIIGVAVFFYGGISLGVKFCNDFPSVPLLLAMLLTYVVYTIVSNLANREKIYGKMAMSSVINGVSQALFRISFGVLPIVAYGLIVGNLLAQVVATIFLALFLAKVVGLDYIKKISWKETRRLAIKYIKFPLYDAPARLIEFAIGNLALLIMTFFWSKDEIGSYSMIIQFILLPITVIGSAMANVYYRELSETIEKGGSVAIATKRAAKISFAVSTLPLLFLTLGGDKLLVLFLGSQWIEAGRLSLCLVIYSVPVILSEPLLPLFRSLNKQEDRFRINLLCFFTSIGGMIITGYLTHNIYISVIVYSIFYALCRYLMYCRLLKLAMLQLKDISANFFLISSVCYITLAVRLFFMFR